MAIAPVDLLQALQAAVLQDLASVARRKAAEAQLKTWETHSGFYSLLQDAFLDVSLQSDIRWIAIIYFKNGIDKYWRKSAPNAIAKDEKIQIRSKITQTFGITNAQLAAQNALAIARISKFDFPVEWPSLFSDMLGLANEAHDGHDLIRLKQVLLVLNQIVKTLSGARFGKTRVALQQATPAVVKFVGQWYFIFTQEWMTSSSNGALQNRSSELSEQLELRASIGYLSLKICRRLVSEGYEFANRHQEASELFQVSTMHLNAFIEKYVSDPSEILEKFIRTLGKFYQDLSERQPTAFILMPGSFDLIRSYLTVLQSQGAAFHQQNFEAQEFWEKVLVRGLILLRRCIKMIFGDGTVTIKYRTPEDREETKSAVRRLKEELCTDSFVVNVHDILLWSYLRLRPSDLEKWANEPEEFVYDEVQNSWEYQLRPCSEKVYIDLLLNFKDLLKPRVLDAFEAASSQNDTSDDAILAKDAAYCAFSIGCNALFEDVDFDNIFLRVFVPQVANASADVPSMHRIILRRISLIISNWISVKCGTDVRKDVYDVLARQLDPSLPFNDTVVQLTAAMALKSAVDEWDFKLDMFLPYLELFLTRLIEMMTKVDVIETKLSLLQVISVIVEVVETRIIVFADKIVALLPSLWEQAGDEHILKGAILQTLTNLIQATGKESYQFHQLYVPLIAGIVDPKSELHVYLNEDALLLWQTTIANAPSATPELLSLLPILIESLDQATDTLRMELVILEGYVLLAPTFVAQQYAKVIFGIMASFIGNLKIEACHTVTHIIELFIQSLPLNAYINDLVETGLMARLTDSIFDTHESAINVTRYLTIYARLSLADPTVVVRFCDIYGTERRVLPNGGNCLGPLLDVWLEKVENMGHPRVRKLTAMGLGAIMDGPAGQQESVLRRREAITKVRGEIFAELEGEEVDLNIDTSVKNLMSGGCGYSV
ncbi:armadillo-type protein [Lipomyces doorenjongii]|uniref:armadillo-type protein n=1 Tax=Lipomyces doorenjongii TaxID=383834 RepID=UPI0034CDD187